MPFSSFTICGCFFTVYSTPTVSVDFILNMPTNCPDFCSRRVAKSFCHHCPTHMPKKLLRLPHIAFFSSKKGFTLVQKLFRIKNRKLASVIWVVYVRVLECWKIPVAPCLSGVILFGKVLQEFKETRWVELPEH